jgi:PAS domain S-box-containing protein
LLNRQTGQPLDSRLEWIGLSLFLISVVLLTIVYFIIRAQIQAKNVSEGLLSENKKLLQSIIDNTTNPIFIKKLNGEYILVNKQYENLFQISNDEIIGKTDHDFLPQATADIYRSSDLEAIKAQKEVKVEETIQQSDGPHTYIAVKFPLYDATGRVYAVGGISTDITERKKVETSMEVGEKFFNMSLDIMVIASKDKFLKINPTMSRILGYSQEELLNQSFFKYIYKNDIESTQKEIEKLGLGLQTIKFENRWVCKDGSVKLLSWSAMPDLTSGLLYAIASDITEEKENQKSLVQAERFFNMAFDIFFLAKGESIVKINPTLTRIFGFELKDYFNKSFLSFVHPDDLKTTTEEVKKLRAGASVVSFKVRSICKDGSYRWVVWSATSDPLTGIIFAAGRDVTELIQKEESLEVANNFFEMSFDSFFVAEGTRFKKINSAFTKTLGYNLKDLETRSVLDLIHPDYVKIARERITKRLEGMDVEKDVIYPVLCKDGSYKWMEAMITTNTHAGIIYVILADITEKRKNEEDLKIYTQKLKDNENQIQTIFDCAPDPVIVIDNESNVIQWNTKAESLFGWKITEVLGKPMYEFIVPARYRQMYKKGMEKFIATGVGPILNKTTEVGAMNKEGKEFPVALSISATKMGDKNIFIGFVRDISEDKKMLNELHEQEEMLRMVLANIAEGVVVTDAYKKIVMSNAIADKVFGMQKDEEILPNLVDHFELYYPDESTVFPSQNLPMDHALNGELMEDVDVILFDPATKEKKRVLISGRPLINQDDKVVAAVVTIKDISKYKQMEAKLKETEIKYRQVIGFNKGA